MNDLKLGKPHYCLIDREYLLKIYNSDELVLNKYDRRPFIYFDNSNLLLAFPERTYRNQKVNDLNYYFKDNKHFIAVQNYLFVPKKYRNNFYINQEFENKLIEINNNKNEIIKKTKKTFMLMEKNHKFKMTHIDSFFSEKICKQELEKEQERVKGPELGM